MKTLEVVGGVSSIMGERLVTSEVNKQILYIDANILYGWAVSQCLPTGEFEKLSFPNIHPPDQIVEDLSQIPEYNEYGFFVECFLAFSVENKQIAENFHLCPIK